MEQTLRRTSPSSAQHFTEFVRERKGRYHGRNGRQEPKSYIPPHEIEEYWSEQNIRTVLKQCQPHLLADSNAIKANFPLTFSLLVYIDEVEHLGVFLHHDIDDTKLPLKSRPSALEGLMYDRLWDALYDHQWTLFPLVIGGRNELADLQLSHDHVLPFDKETLLKTGDLAQIFLVKIHESCNQSPQTRNKIPYTVVLKTYTDSRFRNIYFSELKALTILQEQKTDNIIKYYGSFSQNDTFNLFLGYEDGGNLLESLWGNQSFGTSHDARMFWNGVFDELKAQSTLDITDSGHYRGLYNDILDTDNRSAPLDEPSSTVTNLGLGHVIIGDEISGIGHRQNLIYSPSKASHHYLIFEKVEDHINYSEDPSSASNAVTPDGTNHYKTHIIPSEVEAMVDIDRKLDTADLTRRAGQLKQDFGNDLITLKILEMVGDHMLVQAPSRQGTKEILNEFYDILFQSQEEPELSASVKIHDIDAFMTPPKPDLGTCSSSHRDNCIQVASTETEIALVDERGLGPRDIHASSIDAGPYSVASDALTRENIVASDASRHVRGKSNTDDSNTASPPNSSPVSHSSLYDYSPYDYTPYIYAQESERPAMIPNAGALVLPKMTQGKDRLSMKQAHSWRRADMGAGDILDPELDRIVRTLRAGIDNRDLLFVVDDSRTMLLNREDVEQTFHTLGYISTGMYTNDIEITFTSKIKDGLIHVNQDVTPLLETLRACQYAHDGTSMEESIDYLVENIIMPRLLPPSPRQIAPKGFMKSKPLAIFILTDGCWGVDSKAACGVQVPIRKLVRLQQDGYLNQQNLIIQFIRFGNEKLGMRYLSYLDKIAKDGLCDIVGTRSVTDDLHDIFSWRTAQVQGDPDSITGSLAVSDMYSSDKRDDGQAVRSAAVTHYDALPSLTFKQLISTTEVFIQTLVEDNEILPLFQLAAAQGTIRNRLEDKFRGLLENFSEELVHLAPNKECHNAAIFIRDNAEQVARIACSRFDVPVAVSSEEHLNYEDHVNIIRWQQNISRSQFQLDFPPDRVSHIDEDTKTEHIEEPSPETDDEVVMYGNFEDVKPFLLEGNPMTTLREHLRAFVTSRVKKKSSDEVDEVLKATTPSPDLGLESATMTPQTLPFLIESLLQRFSYLFQEPPVPLGKVRARWECGCGARLYDDYTEFMPGSVKQLERQLQSSNICPQKYSPPRRYMHEIFHAFQHVTQQTMQSIRSTYRNIKNRNVLKNSLQDPSPSSAFDATIQSNISHANSQHILYLLLCIDRGAYNTPLYQEHLGYVKTDRELFIFLRSEYTRHWNVMPWLTLRTMKCLSLTRFAVDLSNMTEPHKHDHICASLCNCLPPKDIVGTEYLCKPAPHEGPHYIPAIGRNRLTHYFFCPRKLDPTQKTILAQIPKRMNSCIAASSEQDAIGWGLHFEEGWHWATVYTLGVLVAVIGLIFGVLWSVMKGSIQDGFAISSFCITFGSLCLGYIALRS